VAEGASRHRTILAGVHSERCMEAPAAPPSATATRRPAAVVAFSIASTTWAGV